MVEPLRYATVADARWNEFFKIAGKNDPFGYARILETGEKGFPEVVHSDAQPQEALLKKPVLLC